MNSSVMTSRIQMEPNLLQQLVAEVKETVATEHAIVSANTTHAFKAIDLWNIQRKSRYINNTKRKKMAVLSVTHISY